MRIPARRVVGVVALGAVFTTGCAAASAHPTAVPTRTVAPAMTATPTATAQVARPTALDRIVTSGKAQYTREVSGGKVRSLLRRVAHDPALLQALATSDAAARAYVARQFPSVWYHWHISRMRITRGSKLVTERGVPFVVDGPQMTLRGANGKALGKLQVSLQDEIGFVRLMHRSHPVDVVVRGTAAADVRSSLPAATHAALPATGTVTIGGRKYAVRSFHETAWSNQPVTIWFLAAV
jgi:hypothetical protein